jgi:hypothetical protein
LNKKKRGKKEKMKKTSKKKKKKKRQSTKDQERGTGPISTSHPDSVPESKSSWPLAAPFLSFLFLLQRVGEEELSPCLYFPFAQHTQTHAQTSSAG